MFSSFHLQRAALLATVLGDCTLEPRRSIYFDIPYFPLIDIVARSKWLLSWNWKMVRQYYMTTWNCLKFIAAGHPGWGLNGADPQCDCHLMCYLTVLLCSLGTSMKVWLEIHQSHPFTCCLCKSREASESGKVEVLNSNVFEWVTFQTC